MSATDGTPRDNAGVVAPPPVIFGSIFIIALFIERSRPFALLPPGMGTLFGVLLMIAGGALAAWGVSTFSRAKTAILPTGSTTTIISGGPYRFTRNPMYVGMVFAYVGGAFASNSYWPLVFLPMALIIVQRGVIYREEAYLERKFGTEYLSYKTRVRRWL
ncbi:MAG TPA: isoprenylcysteine carboxylmethyltransferase family protein [Gemmatimonadaceae bacterium]|nr:isoprenylcysteine carboxylmethyltransferase family protein [Gemmatimonadaceae bacterium]